MSRVVQVVHGERERARSLAAQSREWLVERGHDVVDVAAIDVDFRAAPAAADGADLVISFGGDGTMLRAVQVALSQNALVLGVNLGRLGYLAMVEPDALLAALEHVLVSGARVEERMTLAVSVERPGHPAELVTAFNEAAVERAEPGRTVGLAVSIGGEFFSRYTADGMIVATPTGSTGYNLSAGGPIVSPHASMMVMTPVAPHSLFDRSLILTADDEIVIEVVAERRAVVSIDGLRVAELAGGERVRCTQGARPLRLVRVDGQGFHQVLKTKFQLADR